MFDVCHIIINDHKYVSQPTTILSIAVSDYSHEWLLSVSISDFFEKTEYLSVSINLRKSLSAAINWRKSLSVSA